MTRDRVEFKSDSPAFVTDHAQRIVRMNDAAATLLGIAEPRSVIGQHCYQVVRGRMLDGAPLCETECRVTAAVRGDELPAAFPMLLPAPAPSGSSHNGDAPGRRRPVDVACVVIRSPETSGDWQVLHVLRDTRQEHAALQFATSVAAQAGNFLSDVTVDSRIHSLTNRERRVLELIARGMATAAIAQSLQLSKATVRNHTQHILRKLDCHSRLEAVAMARPLLLSSSFDTTAD